MKMCKNTLVVLTLVLMLTAGMLTGCGQAEPAEGPVIEIEEEAAILAEQKA